MAFVYTVHVQYQSVTHDVCRCGLFREAVPLKGIIQGPGVVPVGVGAGALTFYARLPNDLLGANTESSEFSSCGSLTLPVNCELDSFTTLSGALDGVTVTNRAVAVRARTKYSVVRGNPPPAFQSLAVRYYHVAVGGAETFLGAKSFTSITTAYVNRAGLLTLTASFGVGERLRVKYIGKMTAF